MMPDYVSPLDDEYISLGRAARLIARERPGADQSEILDMFKRAIFAGELEPPPFWREETREHPDNWLHMEIEAPKCGLSQAQAALPIRPRQLYGVGRETITSVLLTTDALPGGAPKWWPMLDLGAPEYAPEDALKALAAIPFREFPPRGQSEIEAILIPLSKLALWLGEKGQPMPSVLSRSGIAREKSVDDQVSSQQTEGGTSAAPSRSQGRPQKAAWPRVVEIARQLNQEHPDWQRRKIAYHAWQLASHEFNKAELPSVATIQRRMAEILKGASLD